MTTTALYKALIEANVSPETAERAVEGLAAADEVATKADLKAELAQLEIRLAEKMADQETRLVEKMADQEARLAERIAGQEIRLAERMADQKVELIKWMVAMFIGFFIANSATIIGAMFAMFQTMER